MTIALNWRERRTRTGWFAIGSFVLGFLLITIAMFSRNWIQAESKAYGTNMDSIGLWVQCFRSLTVPDDVLKETLFTGCRWIFDPFTTHYDTVRDMVQTPFFLTVQIFFTFCFTLSLIGAALVGVLVFCPGEEFEKRVLKLSYYFCFGAWFFGFLSVVIFGAKAESKEWMPHWEHNHLSWSYGLAVIGVVSEFVAAILFYVESQIQRRKEHYRQTNGVYTLDTKA